MKKAIAIDGPAGAGKSTIAKSLAARLGYIYMKRCKYVLFTWKNLFKVQNVTLKTLLYLLGNIYIACTLMHRTFISNSVKRSPD